MIRSQCKLWLVAVTPVALLTVVVIALIHFNIVLFNTTVTLPIPSALLLVAVGYAVHNQRIIELDFYLPWSRIRKYKTLLYQNLNTLTRERSAENAVRHLAAVLKCPAVLLSESKQSVIHTCEVNDLMMNFPRDKLKEIDGMTVVGEGDDLSDLQKLMRLHDIGVIIIPFFPHSNVAASWLLLGSSFNKHIYTPLDFNALQQTIDRLATLLLDDLLRPGGHPEQGGVELRDLQNSQDRLQQRLQLLLQQTAADAFGSKPLDEYVSEFEAAIIKHALESCEWNQAQAAQLPGLRRNTLYYKDVCLLRRIPGNCL